MKLFLLGFMGAGKTTLGKYAARHNGLEFLDLDLYIEEREGMSVRQIFREKSEDAFRQIEHEALKEVILTPGRQLISTGGGTPCFFDNMDRMNAAGTTIYLDMSSARLTERLRNAKGKRPLIESLEGDLQTFIHKKLLERAAFYGRAHFILPEKEANKKGLRALISEIVEAEESLNPPTPR